MLFPSNLLASTEETKSNTIKAIIFISTTEWMDGWMDISAAMWPKTVPQCKGHSIESVACSVQCLQYITSD